MIAKHLKELRDKKDISQAELANILGVAQQTVASWEKEKSSPNYDILKKIASYFHVTTDYLLGNDDTPKPGYYLDEETARIANEMKDRPELKTLFDASRRLRPEDISEVDALIQAKLKRPEYDEMGDGDFSE